MMILYDELYGKFDITEQVLLDILDSPTLKRLKGISQGGYYPAAPLQAGGFSRYDHSIGVFLLLRKFGASLEEQIAGLTHDISHSAFSHTIDYINKDKSSQKDQSHQDRIHDNFLKNSEIADILKKHNIDVNFILDDKNFPLKENDLPNICADRIDYSLRESFRSIKNSYNGIIKQLNDLTILNNQFVFKTYDRALEFTNNFTWCNNHVWSDLGTAVMFSILGRLLRTAIDKEYIHYDDLYKLSDAKIIEILDKTNDNQIRNELDNLKITPINHLAKDNDPFEITYCKVRFVDPYFINHENLTRVSEINKDYAKLLKESPKYYEYKIKA